MLKDTIPAAFILAEVLKLWEQRMLMPFHKKKNLFDHSCITSSKMTQNIWDNT